MSPPLLLVGLLSVDKRVSQILNGHTGTFAKIKIPGRAEEAQVSHSFFFFFFFINALITGHPLVGTDLLGVSIGGFWGSKAVKLVDKGHP